MNETNELIMQVIAYSGESKTYAHEALDKALEGDFEKADEVIKKSKEILISANKYSFKLLEMEANGIEIKNHLLATHALDHLATAEITNDYSKDLIKVLKANRKEKND